MDGHEALTQLESLDDDELQMIIQPSFSKIEILAKLLKICLDTTNGIFKVISYAIHLSVLWLDIETKMEKEEVKENCIEVLKKITNPTIATTEKTLHVSLEIVQEIINRLKDFVPKKSF